MKIGDSVKIVGPSMDHHGYGIIISKVSTTKPNGEFITQWKVLIDGFLRIYNEIFLEVVSESR